MDTRLRGANSAAMRQHNRATVLRALLARGPMPRQELATITGLRPSTITHVVRELIREGLVREVVSATAAPQDHPGRAPVPLEIAAEGALALGVYLGGLAFEVGVVDLAGGVRVRASRRVARGQPWQAVLGEVCDLAERLMVKVGTERLVGLGLASLGVVDPEEGEIEYAAFHSWRRAPVGQLVAARLGLPVVMENSARAMALAEACYGAARGAHSLVFVTVTEMVGAGAMIDGEIYRGRTGLAGEIGHTLAVPDGPLCDCGRHGCLEAVASTRALARMAGELLGREAQPEEVLAGAAAGDPVCRRVVRTCLQPLAVAIANLVDVLDPELVVLGGDILRAGSLPLEEICRVLEERDLLARGGFCPLVPSRLGGDVGLVGAGALVLDPFVRAGGRLREGSFAG